MNTADATPIGLVRTIVRNRGLIWALTRREVLGRYRGSAMGLAWSFFNPLLMLAVYTFVFSVIFRMRWPGGTDSNAEFALVLFSALIAFNLFAECVNRAPGLVLANPNYVTKVIFPLEVLPIVQLLSSLFHAAISLLVWLVVYLFVLGIPPATALLLPLALLPLVLLTLGLTWFLASLGVYLRDVSQFITVATTVLLFVTPIFYAVDSVPAQYRPIMNASPLTFLIGQVRDVMIWGRALAWVPWATFLVGSALIAWLGYAWFQKTRRGFSDVL